VGAIKDWPGLLTDTFKHLNPGGWVEICDFEYYFKSNINSMDQAPDIVSWTNGLDEAATMFGRRMDVAVHLKKWVENAGYIDVVQDITPIPIGMWPKDKELKTLSSYQLTNLLDTVSSYGLANFTRVLAWTAEEYEVFSAKVRRLIKNHSLQYYAHLYVFVYPWHLKTILLTLLTE
jgi:hypothetical protein